MKQVAIIGLGLMGGSLGLALKRGGLARVSASARRVETRRLALETGAVDFAFETAQEAVRGADVVVFCTPVCSIPGLARDCLGAFEPGCVVTDVGSTKAQLVHDMADVFRGASPVFVGSHPMAGSEKTGMEAARADLYVGATTVVTPAAGTPESVFQAVSGLWAGVGAKVIRTTPGDHDAAVARSSHLPHLTAALLTATAGRGLQPEFTAFCGTGFRDTTRVADGSPEMWHDIVKTNRSAILGELRNYEAELKDLIESLESRDFNAVKTFLERARLLRRRILGAEVE